jgi:RecB family endonuclease NucS
MTGVILYFGECTVDYDGRASSYLPSGDRLVLVRPNVVTVHSLDDKVNPVNYLQDADINMTDDTILATRNSPCESLEINFSRVDKKMDYYGSDEAELLMSETEDELQRRLYSEPSMIDDGFVSKEREYDTGAGHVDIRGELNDESCLVEVKKSADMSAVGQLARYLNVDDACMGILASTQISNKARSLLENEYDDMVWREVSSV